MSTLALGTKTFSGNCSNTWSVGFIRKIEADGMEGNK